MLTVMIVGWNVLVFVVVIEIVAGVILGVVISVLSELSPVIAEGVQKFFLFDVMVFHYKKHFISGCKYSNWFLFDPVRGYGGM